VWKVRADGSDRFPIVAGTCTKYDLLCSTPTAVSYRFVTLTHVLENFGEISVTLYLIVDEDVGSAVFIYFGNSSYPVTQGMLLYSVQVTNYRFCGFHNSCPRGKGNIKDVGVAGALSTETNRGNEVRQYRDRYFLVGGHFVYFPTFLASNDSSLLFDTEVKTGVVLNTGEKRFDHVISLQHNRSKIATDVKVTYLSTLDAEQQKQKHYADVLATDAWKDTPCPMHLPTQES
jgi:hypothetical protein